MAEPMNVDNTDNQINDLNQVNTSNEPKGWMQKLGEYAVWGYIRQHIEKQYKNKIYIPVAIKGECLRFLGLNFIDSIILSSDGEKDVLFEILSIQLMHSNILTGLQLLYRASTNGYDATSFHKLCDNQKNLIIIIQSKKGNIFGGYLQIGYGNNNQFMEDKNAFLFSINNNNHKIYPIDEYETEYAVKYQKSSGPAFGGGFDLFICNNCNVEKMSYCKSNGSSYNIQDGASFCGSNDNWESSIKYKFFVKDYEVFQLLS